MYTRITGHIHYNIFGEYGKGNMQMLNVKFQMNFLLCLCASDICENSSASDCYKHIASKFGRLCCYFLFLASSVVFVVFVCKFVFTILRNYACRRHIGIHNTNDQWHFAIFIIFNWDSSSPQKVSNYSVFF